MSDTAHGPSADHDEHAGGGHGTDPNAGVVRGIPPTSAWLLTSALIALVTVVASVVLAVALNDAIPSTAPDEIGVEGEAEPGTAPVESVPAEAEH